MNTEYDKTVAVADAINRAAYLAVYLHDAEITQAIEKALDLVSVRAEKLHKAKQELVKEARQS